MPLSKNRATKGEDVNEKVKEIKQRQQNWMRQRASSLDRDRARSASPSGAPVTKKEPLANKSNVLPLTKVTNSTSFKSSTPDKKTLPTATTYDLQDVKRKPQMKPKGFQVWRQNKAENDESKTTKSGEVNILQVVHPEGNVHERRINSPTESVCTSVSQQTISPDMFDSLADQIVNRVKKELNLNSVPQLPAEHKAEERTYSSQQHRTRKECSKMDSHHCPNCGHLMLAPEHSPMLVIPCGHSFCKTCAELSDSCLNCQQVIQSLTCNIMLQQIITEYNGERHPTPGKTVTNVDYKPTKYEDVDHSEEYQSLCVRCEAVSMEVEDIEHKMKTFDHNIDEENQQIKNITSAQDKINVEIQNLQTKLSDLERHKEEYHIKIEDWTKKREIQKKKLKMTQEMLRQLERERDKVEKLLDADDYSA